MWRMLGLTVLVLGMLLPVSPVLAERVQVLALFPGKALLQWEGQRKVLADGESLGERLRLVEATPSQARVILDGREEVLTLGSAVNASYAEPVRREVRLLKQGDAFFIEGLINGQSAQMLVDTGATHVAISETQARALGIPYVTEGSRSGVNTASGFKPAYAVKLRSLKLAGQAFTGVEALVVEGDSPQFVLLGMNVLSRFHIQQSGNLMVLRAR